MTLTVVKLFKHEKFPGVDETPIEFDRSGWVAELHVVHIALRRAWSDEKIVEFTP